MEEADVIVVGAGLAGLSATIHLQAAGLHVVLLEQSDEVGGRVRTDEVDGFLLDRGFQVLLPAYPELRRLLDLDRLDLRSFATGVLAQGPDQRWDLGLPGRQAGGLRSAIRFAAGRPLDALGVGAFSLRDVLGPAGRLRQAPTTSTKRELARWRISDRTVEEIFRPFLAGVFLDPELDTSSRMFHLVWRCFLRGGAAVPANGMRQLPRELAGLVADGALRPATSVQSVSKGGVKTADGTVAARAVVIATDGTAASSLLPHIVEPSWRSVTTWYFAAPESPLARPVLLLDGASGLLLNTVVMSDVAPSYAPAGRSLISASVPDCEHTADDVRRRLEQLYETSTSDWELIAEYRIPHALPRMSSDHLFTTPAKVGPGLYLCGDYRDTSSIQGALVSGRRVAQTVARDLRRGERDG
ncbi:NAD(P)/FAD-dependent oxidoreductase [Kribbella sp. NPDC051952]|uniref:NAD(P)/FAD-dependent oxidoreductase n=1 Tax=Kribbella sp. NPDC051952 TaxID=3154851 RepID=UPI003438CE42